MSKPTDEVRELVVNTAVRAAYAANPLIGRDQLKRKLVTVLEGIATPANVELAITVIERDISYDARSNGR